MIFLTVKSGYSRQSTTSGLWGAYILPSLCSVPTVFPKKLERGRDSQPPHGILNQGIHSSVELPQKQIRYSTEG